MAQREDGASTDNSSNNEAAPLTRSQIQQRLSVLGTNPFTLGMIYTTARLSALRISDLAALAEFHHLQHVHADQNALHTLAPLADLPMLLSIDASNNQLTEVLDYEVAKCTPSNAWVGGGRWIGSLLRRACLDHNRITRIRSLDASHPFLQELHLAHNRIHDLSGVQHLRFLRVLDLSHNDLVSTEGLVPSMFESGDDAGLGLVALEKLLLAHNRLESINKVAYLPRLSHLDVSYNCLQKLDRLSPCARLQVLHASHNNISDINELNYLIPLSVLQQLSLHDNPVVTNELSSTFYRARVLRRLPQLAQLDKDMCSAKEKVKAMCMHGSEVGSRERVFNAYMPEQQFANFLPPLEFEDDQQLEAYLEQRQMRDTMPELQEPVDTDRDAHQIA
ncbi:TPA: hypothetical protein N0F65_006610 [Lagenidium giganteum]|uniref:Uncharacterized protein n=1 Tax=Lagenidium giganteum TaxID=4803 RepID=A0AAV2ZA72_9STRA|nr:TPA: hypothetical protein N0F65_006610 [Lagenidium giganteum]